jgi:alginate O-acetyltransferase complex protein AlgF
VQNLIVLVCLAALLPPAAARADTRSVYGPEVPGNSAFARFVNAIPGSSAEGFELGATSFDPLKYAAVSPYKPVTPDIYQISAAGHDLEIIPRSGIYYTIVCSPQAITVLEDPAHVDPARAQVFLYNLSSVPSLDLKTADGKTGVILGVRPGASGVKVVNAVPVPLAVWNAGARVASVGDLGLARGSSFSVFAIGGEKPLVFAVKATVAAE